MAEEPGVALPRKLLRPWVPCAVTSCSAAEYNQAVRLASEGKQLMMRYNLRLVYSIARQCQHRGLEMDDMLPEGVVGLEKAIEKFEPEKGFRFSTYSHWWIRQHIHRCNPAALGIQTQAAT